MPEKGKQLNSQSTHPCDGFSHRGKKPCAATKTKEVAPGVYACTWHRAQVLREHEKRRREEENDERLRKRCRESSEESSESSESSEESSEVPSTDEEAGPGLNSSSFEESYQQESRSLPPRKRHKSGTSDEVWSSAPSPSLVTPRQYAENDQLTHEFQPLSLASQNPFNSSSGGTRAQVTANIPGVGQVIIHVILDLAINVRVITEH